MPTAVENGCLNCRLAVDSERPRIKFGQNIMPYLDSSLPSYTLYPSLVWLSRPKVPSTLHEFQHPALGSAFVPCKLVARLASNIAEIPLGSSRQVTS